MLGSDRNRPSAWHRPAAVPLAALVLALAFPAAAQKPPDSNAASAAAEALFQEARRLFDEGKYAEACPKFAQSQTLEPKQGTLLNLAVCHEKEGKTASAWAGFKTAASQAKQSGREDREVFARERAVALEGKLSRIEVTYIGDSTGLVVNISGNAYTMSMLSVALPIDPGTHDVEVSAPGKKPWKTTVTVDIGPITVPIEIPTLEAVAVVAPDPVPPPPQPLPDPDATDGDPGISPMVYVGFGVAGVGLILGAITGGLTLAKSSEIADACPNDECSPEQQSSLDDADTMANISNVGFALAGVGAIVGVVGVVLSLGGGDGSDASEARFVPIVTPNGIGVRGQF